MEYKLIACDMDATALDTQKRLSPKTAAAMEKAIARGKHVVFSTGRNICIVRPYMEMVSGMRYAVTSAGAAVNDILTGQRLCEDTIDAETVKWIICQAAGTDVLPVMYIGDTAVCPAWAPQRAAEFGVPDFAETYRRYMRHANDVFDLFMQDPVPLQKMNLLFADRESRDEVYDRIKLLPIGFTNLTDTIMEINAPGVTKAGGLKRLCAQLGISMAECIAVGDSDNDLEVMRASGLAVAMGNANAAAKAAAQETVSDCDHDGCCEAIERFLL